MDKKIERVIKELEYAKKIHDKGMINLSLSKKDRDSNGRISQQKEIVIRALKREISAADEHIKIVGEWWRGHWRGIEYLSHFYQKAKLSKKEKQEMINYEKKVGTVNWHFRWVKVYWWVLYYLEEFKNKEK